MVLKYLGYVQVKGMVKVSETSDISGVKWTRLVIDWMWEVKGSEHLERFAFNGIFAPQDFKFS